MWIAVVTVVVLAIGFALLSRQDRAPRTMSEFHRTYGRPYSWSQSTPSKQ